MFPQVLVKLSQHSIGCDHPKYSSLMTIISSFSVYSVTSQGQLIYRANFHLSKKQNLDATNSPSFITNVNSGIRTEDNTKK